MKGNIPPIPPIIAVLTKGLRILLAIATYYKVWLGQALLFFIYGTVMLLDNSGPIRATPFLLFLYT
jgi:hypothetical protein